MLVLSRRPQQSLLIGNDVVVTVLEVNGDTVRIGITAPPDVDIHREEVFQDLKRSNAEAATAPGAAEVLTRRMSSPGKGEAAPATRPGDSAPKPGDSAPKPGDGHPRPGDTSGRPGRAGTSTQGGSTH